jgi:hypothetical protein
MAEPDTVHDLRVLRGLQRTLDRVNLLRDIFGLLRRHARLRLHDGHMIREVWVDLTYGLGALGIRQRAEALEGKIRYYQSRPSLVQSSASAVLNPPSFRSPSPSSHLGSPSLLRSRAMASSSASAQTGGGFIFPHASYAYDIPFVYYSMPGAEKLGYARGTDYSKELALALTGKLPSREKDKLMMLLSTAQGPNMLEESEKISRALSFYCRWNQSVPSSDGKIDIDWLMNTHLPWVEPLRLVSVVYTSSKCVLALTLLVDPT